LPEQVWQRFAHEQPQGNIFHTPEMYQVFAQTKGYQPELWAAVDQHNHPLCLLTPVDITLVGGPLKRFTTRAVAYGSVLCDPSPDGLSALGTLLRAYEQGAKGRILFTELRNLSDLSPAQRVLKACEFHFQDHLNYLIDLDHTPAVILQSIGRSTRKKIRRALRQGSVIIKEIDQPEQLAHFHALLERTYSAAQVPLADRSLFEAAFKVLDPRGMVKFLTAWVGDKCVAGSVELLFKDVIYGWYGGVDRRYGAYVPNELLMWHILNWGAQNGYRQYDFGGAGKPDEPYGVRDFKAKFGGRLVCFGRNTCVHAPRMLWLSQKGYDFCRRWL
jgi:hypothetical protein